MEEERNELQVQQNQESSDPVRTKVGFPQAQESPKKSNKSTIFVFLIILVLLGIGGWFFFFREEETATEEDSLSPTPVVYESTPTPLQEETLDREGVSIQILNGTGLSGAAASLKEKLEDLGYSDIKVGNASSQSYKTTEVTFSKGVAENVRTEIEDKLKSLYEDVEVNEGTSGNFDVSIITGYPKDHTPTPTKKPAASPTPTSSVTGTITVSPTTTSTPTPTP